ncbi:unnamed protein product [Trifolium pratense]|uniref:Uncharacterized protein n=1 Tax=Trifolium pratense TaxID=57577 RepID=A0ACB0KI27_TRIPR|nr:unnamed protein product [Trifolium pratense]
MTMKQSPKPNSSKSSSPIKTPHRYLKPGALAKLRDSKITARNTSSRRFHEDISFSQLSPITPNISPNQNDQENMVPSFDSHASFTNRPRCLARKKLFAVTPSFTPQTDTYPF